MTMTLVDNQSVTQDMNLQFELNSFGSPMGQIFGNLSVFSGAADGSSAILDFENSLSSSNDVFFYRSSAPQQVLQIKNWNRENVENRSSRRRATHTEIQEVLERIRVTHPEHTENQLAITWLAENRAHYAGQWVAIQGTRLIANSDRAQEVFAAAKKAVPRPLVVQIEKSELPFAGW